MTPALPLVLVPGLLCSPRLFAPQVAAFSPQRQVIVADHTHDDTIAAIAARILETAPERFALAGLSMGGYIAFAMMRQAPERIAKLALLDTSARPETAEQKEARMKLVALAQAGKLDEVVATLTLRFLHPDHLQNETLSGTIRAMAADIGAEAYVRQAKAVMAREDARPLLVEIGCPTLVLLGDSDVVTPPELSKEISADILGSNLVVVQNCGHLSTIEKPDAVNKAMTEWLAGD